MAYPASVTTVAVTATYTYSDGSGIIPAGTVTFTPNAVLQDATDSRIISVKPLVATLDNTGAIAVTLMNTSDTDLTPTGWAYTVTENIAGNQRQYDVFITGASVDLSTLAPVSTTAQYGYVLTTAVGAPSGVASLDSGGNVPLAQLGNAPGGSSVASVNGHTGVVVLTASDVSADASGAAAAAQAAAIAASAQRASNLSDLTSATTARTNLGLGTAATQSTGAFDASGAAAAVLATSAQKASNLSDLASPSTARTNLGLGTAATQATGAFDASGAAAAAQAASQPLDSDLTTIAGLTATTDNLIQSVAGAWASRTPAQAKATLALVKGDVGLGNVDNTSDANKPVSTAQAAADAVVLAASQPVDADLTALAALAATAGMLARTGAGAFAVRTLTGSTETGVTNGDGSGNPTLTVTAVAPTASAVGDTVTNGGVATHRHAREAFAAPTGQNQGSGSAGSAATVVHSDHAHPYDLWSHLDHVSSGAWNMDPALLAGQTTASPVAGTIYVAKMWVPAALAGATSIWLHVITAGVGLTSGQCFAALFDASKNLLQTTTDQSGSWNSAGTKQMTISSQAVAAAAAYVGIFQNFATSAARFHAGSNGIAAINFGLSAANSRFATDATNTARTTSMPSALGTLAATNNAMWVAIS